MGLPIDRADFAPQEYARFSERLQECLAALRELLAQPGFGAGPRTLGAELEVSIIDSETRPLLLDHAALPHILDEQITLELDRFNLEYNLSPLPLDGAPFSALAAQLARAGSRMNDAVRRFGGRVVPIGILPTLQPRDLEQHAMTDMPRYRALSAALRSLRQAPFRVDIGGLDPLVHESDDMALEGAATSFQVHLRVAPEEFCPLYNAAQLATPLALAVSTNSPIFLERRLWDETRIALFQQATDHRSPAQDAWLPARVSIGHGWLRRGALELFAEAVALYPPLLPVLGPEDPVERVRAGRVPKLDELRLHQGTVWRWNRAIFDPAAGGHLRIELRALPSGPTALDMAANAALLVGLTLGLAPGAEERVTNLPWELLCENFERAARHGLRASLLWPRCAASAPVPRPARELLRELLPVAEAGLAGAGIDAAEIERMLGVIRGRLDADVTPSGWLRRALAQLEAGRSRSAALQRMLESYLEGVHSGKPVHEWSAQA